MGLLTKTIFDYQKTESSLLYSVDHSKSEGFVFLCGVALVLAQDNFQNKCSPITGDLPPEIFTF